MVTHYNDYSPSCLQELGLGGNPAIGDEGFAALAAAPLRALQRLDLSDAGLTGEPAACCLSAPPAARCLLDFLPYCLCFTASRPPADQTVQ